MPLLVAGGHEVVAMTRSPQKAAVLHAAGAQHVVADALDRAGVVEAVRRARPAVVIHQLTGLTGVKNLKNFDREFALTNRLRTESIDYLLAGARAAGAARLIAQSYGGWTYGRSGSGLKTEDDPLDPAPPANQRASLAALRYLDEKVAGASDLAGLAFRYANFYGPGSSIALDGEIVAMVRKRQLPVIGTGAGCGRSFTSMTPPRPPWRRSGPARPASTTSSTTSRHPSPTGCPNWPARSGPGRRGTYRSGSGASRRAMSASR